MPHWPDPPRGTYDVAMTDSGPPATDANVERLPATRVLWVFLRLGATAFGGPIAHLALFHREFVERRRWVSPERFASLVTLCQTLPGPSSSQVALLLGHSRGGLSRAFAAWLGFTLPGAVVMAACAALVGSVAAGAGWILGLETFAVAVVAQAVWSMGRVLCPDPVRLAIALSATLVCRLLPGGAGQTLAILVGAALGQILSSRIPSAPATAPSFGVEASIGSRRAGLVLLGLFAALFVVLPVPGHGAHPLWTLVDGTFHSGALVFGGGHVVLPLLQAQVAAPLHIASGTFLAGYGIVQGLPGPLFNIAAYLGWIAAGAWGAVFATVAIFLPGSLLALGALPFWSRLQGHPALRRLLPGVNAAVVGVLFAAFLDPVCARGLRGPLDVVLAIGALGLLLWGKVPSWVLALGCAAAGMLLHRG